MSHKQMRSLAMLQMAQQQMAAQAAHLAHLNQQYQAATGASTYVPMMGNPVTSTSPTTANIMWVTQGGNSTNVVSAPAFSTLINVREVVTLPDDGVARRVELPDGAVVRIEANGAYTIEDKDAKVVYRACRVREFNRYVNTSDLLEDFINFCGAQHVRQGEMLELPIKLFIGWLAIRAAEADGEPAPAVPALPDRRPRCRGCGRFLPAALRVKHIAFCRPVCLERALAA